MKDQNGFRQSGPTIGGAIRQLRRELGYSQQDLAVRLDMAISSIVRYESTRPPGPTVLRRLYQLAVDSGKHEAAAMFQAAVAARLGARVDYVALGAAAGLALPKVELILLRLRHQLLNVEGAFESKIIAAIAAIDEVLPAIQSLNSYSQAPPPPDVQQDRANTEDKP